jgi:hypothetical protein
LELDIVQHVQHVQPVQPPEEGSMAKVSGRQVALSDIAGINKEIRQASDRTAVIVLSSWVERQLEQWIISVLPRNDPATVKRLVGRDGSLGGFYSKIELGYALALYDETTRDNLNIVRSIRNEFAHTPQAIDFETAEIRTEVDKLTIASANDDPDIAVFSEARRKFTNACAMVVTRSGFGIVRPKIEALEEMFRTIEIHRPDDILASNAIKAMRDLFDAIKKLDG